MIVIWQFRLENLRRIYQADNICACTQMVSYESCAIRIEYLYPESSPSLSLYVLNVKFACPVYSEVESRDSIEVGPLVPIDSPRLESQTEWISDIVYFVKDTSRVLKGWNSKNVRLFPKQRWGTRRNRNLRWFWTCQASRPSLIKNDSVRLSLHLWNFNRSSAIKTTIERIVWKLLDAIRGLLSDL